MGARRGTRGSRRATALAVACLLLVGPVPAAVAAPDDPAPVGPLAALEDEADGALAVTRDPAGQVVSVGSTDGEAVVATTAATPAAAAQEVLAEHGDLVGVDGTASRTTVAQVLDSGTGGSVVRSHQVVDGLRVVGGAVVTVLDADRDLVSLSADTSRSTDVTTGVPTAALAAEAARRSVAGTHRLSPGALSTTDRGPWLYDPAVVGVEDPAGARAVRWVEVRGAGGDARVQEAVLVGADGAVALQWSLARGATRVCDRGGVLDDAVEECTEPVRQPDDPATGVADVDAAHEHLAETVATYDALGIDLPALLGGAPTATVGWCAAAGCAPDAFWDQQLRQAYFGPGTALAEDVVAHELTHGWVQATAGLLYLQQSGAIDEAVADVMGELVDQRHGADDDGAWLLGEDAPGFTPRSLADPSSGGRPDRMTSELWVDEDGARGADRGGVHTNLGVGVRTAYLVSQGGEVEGRTLPGIDGDDPGLTKSATLWAATVPQLTPGADYADLGRVLQQTCVRLAADGTADLTADDCVGVREAVAATELGESPVVGRQPVTAPVSCPVGTTTTTLRRDDDGVTEMGFDDWAGGAAVVRDNAVSGRESRGLLEPLPGSAPVELRSGAFDVPGSAGGTFVHFHHASSFLLDDEGVPVTGSRLLVERRLPSGEWTGVGELPWRNAPTDRLPGGTGPVFAGDSRGWGASQVDLTPLAGQAVRLRFQVVDSRPADAEPQPATTYGWWLDDVRVYSCVTPISTPPVLAEPRTSGTAARLTWGPPASQAREVAGYRVTRSDSSAVLDLPAAARSADVGGLTGRQDVEVRVAALGVDGRAGPAAVRRVEATSTALTAPTRVRRDAAFTLTGRVVELGTSTGVPRATATLQRLPSGARTWTTVATTTASTTGALRWTVRQRSATSYRVVVTAAGRFLGSTSPTRVVRLR